MAIMNTALGSCVISGLPEGAVIRIKSIDPIGNKRCTKIVTSPPNLFILRVPLLSTTNLSIHVSLKCLGAASNNCATYLALADASMVTDGDGVRVEGGEPFGCPHEKCR
jgi:hypothetical protein